MEDGRIIPLPYKSMDSNQKQKILSDAKDHLSRVGEKAAHLLPETENNLAKLEEELRHAKGVEDQSIKRELVKFSEERLEAYKQISSSPYFARCDFDSSDSSLEKTIYLGKFSFPEEFIYSWVSPVAKLRFQKLGATSYESETGRKISGFLNRRDQLLVVNRDPIFFSTESYGQNRELIYQRFFSEHRSSFALAEIIERIEETQDRVIRAPYYGPLLISGPAGSGKTTLALHRIAYLLQSPETAQYFNPDKVLVLVQDDSTLQYFSALLPNLGIHRVQIKTFFSWARDVLDLPKATFVSRLGPDEVSKDRYEYSKNKALNQKLFPQPENPDPWAFLTDCYAPFFGDLEKSIWREQVSAGFLDRFDLTILLSAVSDRTGGLCVVEKFYEPSKTGRAKPKFRTIPLEYSLVVLDEVQNYLPRQIEIIKNCLSPKTRSLTYVGDLAQQTVLHTLCSWSEVGESFSSDRLVSLEKVYRSTREILSFLASLGYSVSIDKSERKGEAVEEKIFGLSVFLDIQKYLSDNPDNTVGVLATSSKILKTVPEGIRKLKNVRVLTMPESQGVEFDQVFFLADYSDLVSFLSDQNYPEELKSEKKKALKDLLYVALTRAVNNLSIYSDMPTRDFLAKIS